MAIQLLEGDAIARLKSLPDQTFTHGITSPPYYGQFDYQLAGQYGLEPTLRLYLRQQRAVYRELWRCLCWGGVLWIVIGDTFSNQSPIRCAGQRRKNGQWLRRRKREPAHRQKELLDVPAKLSRGMRWDGWIRRHSLIWDKTNGGSSLRPTVSDAPGLSHESILMMFKAKGIRPYAHVYALSSSVLHHPRATHPDHPCPFPRSLVDELLDAAAKHPQPHIIDPFVGSGTTAIAAAERGWDCTGIDLSVSVAEQECYDHNQGSVLTVVR